MSEAKKYQVGGQAVIEGVMMRSKNFWSLSVRKPDKSISSSVYRDISLVKKYPALGIIFIRGTVILIENLMLGFKALSYSINEATDQEIKFSKKWIILV